MVRIKSPFTGSEEKVLGELRAQRDKVKRQRPLPKLGGRGRARVETAQ